MLQKSNRRNKENVVPPVEPVASVASKRNFVEIQVMQVDKTALICEALIQSFDTIPNKAHGLISLIDASLIRKLPVSFHEESKYPQLAEYIQTSDDECESSLAKHISCILTSDIFEKQILDGTSEDMLHWAIDSLIRIPLQIFRENLGGRVLPIEIDRNSKDQGMTTISNKRPDFLCWTNGVLIFKGEEKAEIDDFPVAVSELTDKFNKFDPLYFGDIQFMICYVVAGSKLRFYAINGLSNTNPLNHLVSLSNLLDIKNSWDRISILSIIVNIARIIRTVSNTISSTIVPIGKRLKLEKSTITFFDDSVEKMIPLKYLPYEGDVDDRVAFLQGMYDCAIGRDFQLRNENEVRAMVYSVVTGLTWLHKNSYVHRDIWLANILFLPGVRDYRYILTDFEYGNASGLKVSERLKDWDDSTLTKNNKYTVKSDLYINLERCL
ncbi:hypothetical protein GLOIN_2v1781656 [Rhizophagus irregularis DAOM 181602=DAOM 197198]|uniref:Protein kinase domain-containing protein n=2 Tax=Rhizophagus irregularis TaxID=588596 RepID=A0A2P4PJE4_RHIID|nr:hypothetical protein GLOIN_2v1781656 [Rhizophagus irregularis DAOM 181602=DAOM 197198]POG65506.1 hypothetical protein GLOIN_2v1781656 [Rhizophagus irregularis DAOM 181602=DAOM 197198]|eukprot:XP_025172372.1 hypothetical protein GLOIN_2v1781656 [Rhizophagus irregularis DAOM 181602=DAOM 197198]